MSDCRHNAPNRGPEAGDVQTQRQQLDERTREELADRLVECMFSQDEPDLAEIDRYLEQLNAIDDPFADLDVEQDLAEFHEKFGELFEDSPREVQKPSRGRRPLARIAIIAAALCAFVVTAQASGLDILGAIARWTSEQFSFVTVGEEKDERQEGLPYASLQEALEDTGVTELLAPTKFPDGTELLDVQVRDEKGGTLFSASYLLGEEKFYISIRRMEETPHGDIEINDSDIELYVAGGIEHHIMTDVKQIKATWNNGPWECYIAGNLSRDDLLVMIDSIYK